MSEHQAQLTIPLHQQALARFENFHTGANGELVHRLKKLAMAHGSEAGLWLWGSAGHGKSHLLQATCHAVSASQRRALYLPLDVLPADADILEGLDADLVALDDVQTWLEEPQLEAALMAFYTESTARGRTLICAAPESAQRASFVLADLASRLRALPGYPVALPDDAGVREVLCQAANRQGLVLTDSVLDFWLHRSSRALPRLLEELALLDARSLVEQRAVTIPLIKEVLAL